jgi:hypothetical protein
MDPLLLRFLERLSVVFIGAWAIYLGFRLFLDVPELRDSAGKVVLPWNISVAMTRVGPGVFFALFGVAAVGLSLMRPLEIGPGGAKGAENDGRSASIRYAAAPALGDRDERANARALLRREMAALNTLPRQLRADLAEDEREFIERRLRRVKLALMRPVWGEPDEGFGDIAAFEQWVDAGEPEPPPQGMAGALALYRVGTREPGP